MMDYLIVGQGIAGTMLSWFLMQSGQKVLVVDRGQPFTASKVASGLSNPITGRRMVKTWMADDIFPFMESTYRDMEQKLNEQFFGHISLFRLFDSVKAQNDWTLRLEDEAYRRYLQNNRVVYFDKEKINNDYGAFEINGVTKLETGKFLGAYRKYLIENNCLTEEEFANKDMRVENGKVYWKDCLARCVIFCEGASAMRNPYFRFFPFQAAKGERLKVRMRDFYADRVISGEVFVMPEAEPDIFYIGATHDWYFDDDQPSEKGKTELLANLQSFLRVPFEVMGHEAAIRPAVKDRRPFIGLHPEFPCVGIFNGLGTKGYSLAPYFAFHFTKHLVQGKPLLPEVDIHRFL